MIRLRWLLTHLLSEHTFAPAVVIIGVSWVMVSTLAGTSL